MKGQSKVDFFLYLMLVKILKYFVYAICTLNMYMLINIEIML